MRPAAGSVLVAALVLALAAHAAALHPTAPNLLGPARSIPIVVHGDAGFLLPPDISGVRGGHGSALDPFRIEAWSITSLPTNPTVGDLGYSNVWVPCILLQNTQAHVVIRHNFLHGNNCHGIWLQNASNVVVERNTILHNTGHGILVESFGPPFLEKWGCNIVIRDNLVKGNGFDGVRVFHALDVRVERNTLVGNANFGLLARSVEGLQVMANRAEWNDVVGIIVEMTPGALLEGNVARHNPTGLDLEFSDGGILRNNLAEDNRDLGIYTSEESRGTLVEGNVVRRNGLDSLGWDDGIALNGIGEVARGNLVEGNRDGIATRDASARIEGNVVRGNQRGIVLEECGARVERNAIVANGEGVRVRGLGGCAGVEHNDIRGNALGALADDGTSASMPNNWWGHTSGPLAPGNPAGLGDVVQGSVGVHPWRTAPAPGVPA
jgi:parallel beta-helix repeat protein